MVDGICATTSSINLSTCEREAFAPLEASPPRVIPSDIGEALALFMVKLGREQRDAARALRESAEAMMHDAQQEQLDAMRSQARAELSSGLAGAMGSFAEAGVNLRSASIKQSVADIHAERPRDYGRAQEQAGPKLDRLKALSAGISGTTRVFEASFGVLASNAKTSSAEAEQRAGNLSKRADSLRSDERDAQAFINAGLDALRAYEQRVHETRTAAIFR